MSQAIRAIYESGTLRLLDPVELSEGQEVSLTITPPLTEKQRIRAALKGIIVEYPADPSLEGIDIEALMEQIELDTRGKPSLSDDIIEERREKP